MFDFGRLFRWVAGAASSVFGETWAAIAALAVALKVDVAVGKQAIFAAGAAAIAAVATAVVNWIKQLRERGGIDESAAVSNLLSVAVSQINEAKRLL